MKYEILRIENFKKESGEKELFLPIELIDFNSFDEIFIDVKIIDDDNYEYCISKWLTVTELLDYKKNKNLENIIFQNKKYFRELSQK